MRKKTKKIQSRKKHEKDKITEKEMAGTLGMMSKVI
jgi:hypothetical protein